MDCQFYFIMSFSGFNPQIETQVVQIRDGTIYQELIGVKRVWVHPWRDAVCQISSAYYDITIMELGTIESIANRSFASL